MEPERSAAAAPKSSNVETPQSILSDESEEFFTKLASDDGPFVPFPHTPLEQSVVQTRDLAGADQVPLPTSPPAEAKDKNDTGKHKARKYFGYIQSKIGPLPFTKARPQAYSARANFCRNTRRTKPGQTSKMLPPRSRAAKASTYRRTQRLQNSRLTRRRRISAMSSTN